MRFLDSLRGSGAIGRAICFKFASKGGKVYVSGRTEASVKNVVSEIRNAGLAAEPLVIDVSDETSVDRAFASINKIDVYINDKFVEPSLLSGEKTTIHVARLGSPDLENYPQLFVELLGESVTDDGLPKNLFLQSDDINGRLAGHEYELNTQDGKAHYSYSKETYYLT